MEDNCQSQNLSLKDMANKVWSKRMPIIRNCVIAFVVACLWIFPQPRTYQATVILAPEANGTSSATSGLSGLAASFGINLGKSKVVDAIYPTIYPNVMESKDFIVGLMDVMVTTSDPDEPLTTTYYDYLTKHQKQSIWSLPFKWIRNGISAVVQKMKGEETDDTDEGPASIDLFKPSPRQERLINSIPKRIICNIDEKTCIITLAVNDQDPLVCATMADSVQTRLQRFITNYKTGKARIDADYYSNLCTQARQEYEEALNEYSTFQDTHVNATLQSTLAIAENLKNNLQIKQTTYTTFMTQYETAKAKVQEETPSFTILQSASIPTMPIAPKRGRFVIIITFLTGLCTVVFYMRQELKEIFAKIFTRKDDDEEDDF